MCIRDRDWEVIRRISEHLPDAEEATMYCNAPVEDGRYRLAWFSDGPWTRLWDYRGMTNSLMDLYTNPEDVHHVCRRVVDFFKRAAKRGVEEAHIDEMCIRDRPTLITLGLGMVLTKYCNFDIFEIVLWIFSPLAGFAQTMPGFILCCFIPAVLYSMGISSWLFGAVTTPIFLAGIQENINMVAQGLPATNIRCV